MSALTDIEISQQLTALPDWSPQGQTLSRTFKFADFLMSIAFVRRIAKRAEKIRHYPEIDVHFDHVTVNITTPDASGLTEKDFTLARLCDEVFSKFLEW